VLVVVRPYKTAAIESVALGIALPALAPPFLCVAGHRIVNSHLRPDAAVAFALPFVMALSMCYLSVYTPMRAAWIESQVRFPSIACLKQPLAHARLGRPASVGATEGSYRAHPRRGAPRRSAERGLDGQKGC